MEQIKPLKIQQVETIAKSDNFYRDAKETPNALLQRLINEVKVDKANNIFAYDRAHNRHNRGR